ncbi:uncharacterized protein LOC135811630 isoform X2 [Sycon ciliatum]|uniref:uncharacterized protein LOC135811630 isoform X2 n=1 Tax=Sycon ciliatum TaxID=27933 RepID=UPI0031F6AD28
MLGERDAIRKDDDPGSPDLALLFHIILDGNGNTQLESLKYPGRVITVITTINTGYTLTISCPERAAQSPRPLLASTQFILYDASHGCNNLTPMPLSMLAPHMPSTTAEESQPTPVQSGIVTASSNATTDHPVRRVTLASTQPASVPGNGTSLLEREQAERKLTMQAILQPPDRMPPHATRHPMPQMTSVATSPPSFSTEETRTSPTASPLSESLRAYFLRLAVMQRRPRPPSTPEATPSHIPVQREIATATVPITPSSTTHRPSQDTVGFFLQQALKQTLNRGKRQMSVQRMPHNTIMTDSKAGFNKVSPIALKPLEVAEKDNQLLFGEVDEETSPNLAASEETTDGNVFYLAQPSDANDDRDDEYVDVHASELHEICNRTGEVIFIMLSLEQQAPSENRAVHEQVVTTAQQSTTTTSVPASTLPSEQEDDYNLDIWAILEQEFNESLLEGLDPSVDPGIN